MPNSDDHIVDILLPKNEIHLLAGPSGAGKTRWLLHQLLEWETGADFLGHRSHPVPWVYIAGDRTVVGLARTLNSMGIHRDITVIPAWDKAMRESEILDKICHSKCHLAVWESFGSFVDPPAQGHQVKAFLNRMNMFCVKYDKTILGIMESPKLKPYERYENPRQRISGAAAWGHHVETIFLVEQEDFEHIETPYRTLHVCLRNGPAMKFSLAFDPLGRLLPEEREPAAEVVARLRRRGRPSASA